MKDTPDTLPRARRPGVAPMALLALAAVGCGQPLHMQYDHGRAYTTAMQVQADLSRPSASASAYALSGVEGLEVRQRVVEESTDTESNMAEFIQSFTVE